MGIIIRQSQQLDLDQVYELNTKCFLDPWHKSKIAHYLDNSFVIENKDNNKIIGVLLQGDITPCNLDLVTDHLDSSYKSNVFIPVNNAGKLFLENKIHCKEIYGIVMICIDYDFRSKGLAQKLIEKHLQNNPNKLLCLNVRVSNNNAYNLYRKFGYEHIAFIKNNYVIPNNEDSMFMIKEFTPTK